MIAIGGRNRREGREPLGQCLIVVGAPRGVAELEGHRGTQRDDPLGREGSEGSRHGRS